MGFKQQGEHELLLTLPSKTKYFGNGAIRLESLGKDEYGRQKMSVTLLDDHAEEVLTTHRRFDTVEELQGKVEMLEKEVETLKKNRTHDRGLYCDGL